ncbi:MAG: hypothetical protein J0H83_15110 [Candidatus Melainabacteria bacterium]|nr:hypothetical protein [Candidatus Melainabacteria bacterium]
MSDKAPIGRILVALYLIVPFLYGSCISGLVLREPDICFLLAMGREISQSGIPATDPFLFAAAPQADMPGLSYVVYQWLFELVLYQIYNVFSAPGILVFAAILQSWAFGLAPYRFFDRLGIRGALPLFFCAAILFGSFSHLCIRPEIVSQFFCAIEIELLLAYMLSRSSAKTTTDWRLIGILTIVSNIWANSHCLFPLAPALCLIALIACTIAWRKLDNTLLTALASITIATMATPYGIKLWTFLPSLFFNPINTTINELAPINWGHVASPVYTPFFALVILCAFYAAKGFLTLYREHKIAGLVRISPEWWFALAMAIPAVTMTLKSNRSVSLALIMMAASLAVFMRGASRQGEKEGGEGNFWVTIFGARKTFTNTIWITLTALGALMMTRVIPPTIPQGSAAFEPPLKAVAYLDEHLHTGADSEHIFNTPHFGNVLIWQSKKRPQIYFDSRYFLFDMPFRLRFWRIINCKQNWQAEFYKPQLDFKYVFIEPKDPLAMALFKDSNWRRVYADDLAVIFYKVQ